jgi:hypothetical protein
VKLRDLERHLAAHAMPRHSEIGPGLVRAICRQLDIAAP